VSRWQKIAGWSAVAIFGLVLLVVVTVTVLVHSESFHHYLIGKVEASASDSLNAKVRLRDFKLSLSSLTLDLYDLDIHSSELDPKAPLLHVDHIGGSVKIISAIHRQWNLSDVRVDHPVVHLLVDKDGNNNLPKPKPSNSNSNTNIFDLAVKRAALNNGEVYYNDRKSDLDANLLEVAFQSSYDPARGGRYYGTLGYKQGNLHFGSYSPLQHDLSTSFDADRSGVKLDPVNFVIGQSHIVLHAAMQNYSSPVVRTEYDAVLDAAEFRRILKNASVPAGIIHLAGSAQYRTEPNQPMLNTVSVNGNISSPSLLIDKPGLRAEVRGLDGRYQVKDGNAELSAFRANAFGGEITATGSAKDLAGAGKGTLHATAKGLSAAALKTVANSPALKDVTITGQLNATADASWSGSMNHLAAATDADLQASVSNPSSNGSASIPVNAVIHAKYAGDSKTVAVHQSYLRTPQTSINLDGTMANRSNLQIQARTNDLAELETLAALVRTPSPGQPAPQPLGLRGTATFDGQVRGTTANPQLTGQLAANGLQVHGSSWRQLRTNVALSPSSAALQNGSLIPATRGKIGFNIQVGLKKWAYTSSNPINVVLNANQVSLQDLQQAANQNYPATGTLNLNVNVHGTQLDPIGNGTLSLVNAKVSQEPIQSVNVNFNGTGEVVHANLDVRIPAGETRGTLTYYPKQQGYEVVLKAANLQLGQLQTLRAKNMQIAGALNIDVSGHGTINDPGLQAAITIPQLQVRDQVMKGISLQANVANHVGTFTLNSEVQNTYVKAKGRVNLTGDYLADATFHTQGIPLQPIFAVYAPAQAPDMNGETELHATIKGPLKKKEQLEAHASIPVLRVSYKQLQIAAAEPIKFDYANSVLTVQPSEIKGTGTDLRFGGRIPMNPGEPASLNATGNLDLQLAQIFVPDLSSRGEIKFDIKSGGDLKNPDVQGNITIENANILPADAPLGLENANGELTLTRDRLQVKSFTGTVGGGQVNATGGVIYKPALQFNVALSGKGIHFIYNDAVRLGADSNLALTGNLDSAYLRGQVALTRLAFTPDFDLTTFASSFSGGSVSAPSGGFMQNLKLAVTLQSASQLNLVSRGLSLQGTANLRVVGTADNPVILGRTTINNGDLIFNGNRYLLQDGSIEFVNPVETEPVVNLAVNTTINEYNINLRMHGPVTQLQTTYTSDPSLPPVDIINLIAFGKTTEASAQQSAQSPQSTTAGAESLIASGITGQVTSRVSKIAGISQLSIDPGLGGGGQNTGPKIAVQQRVTGNLFVTFSSDLTGTQREQIQVEYHLSPKWSVSGIRDQNGGFGFDARAHRDF
jgi:translocation and assembly module TamB